MTACSRRGFLKAAGAAAAAALLPRWLAAAGAGAMRVNLVFILMDDLGQRDLGCYGSTFYETPNLDRLAAQGMRFTSAYAACPVCSPTRASIMAGKYPARLNLTNYIAGMRKGKLIPPEYLLYMPLEEFTLAEAFKEAGYATCFIGKWHMGGEPYGPDKQGFDVKIASTAGGAPRSYFSPYNLKDLADGPPGEYLTDRLTDEALKFLDSAKDKPFLLYLSHYAVHIPLQAKKDVTVRYEAKAAALPPQEPRFLPEGDVQARQVQDHPVYAAMVQSMDESVGRVMRKLDELGLADRTAVIFMSDNGGLSTAEGTPTSNVPLRAGKGWLYEGGIREPLIIKWPGVTRPGSTCVAPVTSTDFYPTMLEMAGLPPRPGQHCDGVSIVPLLKGGQALPRKAIFWHYPHYSNQGGGPSGAVRAGDLKLIEFYEDGRAELYNVRDDIGEKNDLAARMPERAAELKAMLADWRKEVGAKMPAPAPGKAGG
ncbi:MAG: sulfatase [Planctomycetes bacterium]|nr:sulfatase [Planctomycetota bacterium]